MSGTDVMRKNVKCTWQNLITNDSREINLGHL